MSTASSMTDYGYGVEVPEGYDEAVIRTRLALKGEGFSILTESNVGGLLGPEAGEARQYLFMAVWNAPISERRIDSSLQVAVHLPCNVIVQDGRSAALVAALDPAETAAVSKEAPEALAEAARDALTRALSRVGSPEGSA